MSQNNVLKIIKTREEFEKGYSEDPESVTPCYVLGICINSQDLKCRECELFKVPKHTSSTDLYNKSIDMLRLVSIGMSEITTTDRVNHLLVNELKDL